MLIILGMIYESLFVLSAIKPELTNQHSLLQLLLYFSFHNSILDICDLSLKN